MTHVLRCIGHDLKIPNIVNSSGAYVHDDRGTRFLDLESGIWCVPLGHKNARVNDALSRQMSAVTHAGFCYSSQIVEDAAHSVLAITGQTGGKCVFLCSGSEAVELALQMSKHVTKKPRTMCLHDAFLGSYGSITDRGKGWHLFDWVDCAKCPVQNTCDRQCPKLQDIPNDISEFVFEPGSASGFVRFPPKALIKNIVKIIRAQGGKIVVNEITTGMGRTGAWFGFNHYDIEPDLVAIGKGLGNGYPVSAVAISPETVKDLQNPPFYYSQSHQNDPLGAAVAHEVIAVMIDENLVSRAHFLSDKFFAALQKLTDSKHISEVRGRGMMFAVEFSDSAVADRIYEKLLSKGYIVCNRYGKFRIDPPLGIEEDDFMDFVKTFATLLNDRTLSVQGKSASSCTADLRA